MALKRLLVGAITQGTTKATASALTSALTVMSNANSSAKGMEKQPLTSKAIGK